MRSMIRSLSVSLLALGLSGCGSQTTAANPDMAGAAPSPDLAQPKDPLLGTWESKGADVAPLLAGNPFNYTQITAKFMESSYVVTAVDKDMKSTSFTGTWQAAKSSVMGIWDITLNQSMPSAVVSKGIYQIDVNAMPNRMTYEVVQVQPDIMVTPPTAMGGFGSTQGGKLGMSLVQKYSRIGQ